MNINALDNNPKWINFRYYGSFLYFPVAFILYLAFPYLGPILLGFSIVAFIQIISRRLKAANFIDNILSTELGFASERLFYLENFPDYQFVDIHNSVKKYLSSTKTFKKNNISNPESLNDILNHRFHSELNRTPQESDNISWKVSEDEDIYLKVDNLWIVKDNYPKIIRLRYDSYNNNTILEVSTTDSNFYESFIKDLKKDIIENSIYRGKVLSITSQVIEGIDYGEKSSKVGIQFQKINRIKSQDIILSDKIKNILDFNVFEFFHNHEILSNNLPTLNRGLLFYGPPGTGKSFTSQYLFGRLENVTIIVASGQSLTQINTISSIGRTLQPSIILLEDVDLVFSSRELNNFNSTLGDLMNQLDGYAKKEHMLFILTTNHIERVEKAIKDRPGRISQCVYFDLPNLDLRIKYLKNEIKNYLQVNLDIEGIAKKIEGASQAFISELVKLAIQANLKFHDYHISSELQLSNKDFDFALDLMLRDNNEYSKSILGISQSIL